EPLANIHQAHTSAPACRSLRIECVLHLDAHAGIFRAIAGMQPYPSTFGEIRDSMRHRILDQGLQYQRRHHATEDLLVDIFLHIQARSKTDLLYREKRVNQRQLLLQGNQFFFAKSQSGTKEVGEGDTHLTRPFGIAAGKRADGMKAVKEEMRIHLRLERPQLGVAGQHSGLRFALLRLARRLLCQQHIEQSDCEQIQQHSDGEQQANVSCHFFIETAELGKARESACQGFGHQHPEETDDDRCQQMRKQKTGKTGLLDGNAAAGVPGGKTNEGVEQAQREEKCRCLKFVDAALIGDDVEEQLSDYEPCNQIKGQAPRMSQNGVHGLPALDLNTAEDSGSPHVQRLHRSVRTRRMTSFVNISAEDADSFHQHTPAFGHDQFTTAKYGRSIDDGFIGFHVGTGNVDLESAKDGHYVATLKIFSFDLALDSSEDAHRVQRAPVAG